MPTKTPLWQENLRRILNERRYELYIDHIPVLQGSFDQIMQTVIATGFSLDKAFNEEDTMVVPHKTRFKMAYVRRIE